MKTPVLVLGLAAVIAVGGWFALRGGGATDAGPALEQERVAPSPEIPADTELDAAVGAADVEEESVAPASERTEVDVADAAEPPPTVAPPSLRVLVLDADDRPVPGVEVQITERRNNWDHVRERATTAEDGLVAFEDVTLDADPGLDRGGPATHHARVELVAASRVDVSLDPSMLGRDEPVELRLPSVGSVAVEVRDADGEPARGEVTVQLIHVPEGESRVVSPFGRSDRLSVRANAEAGVARFPLVECGLDVSAVATRDINNVPCSAFGAGPLRPGEETRLEARFGDGHPVVRFRVLDAAGVPLPGASLNVAIQATGGFLPVDHEIFPSSDEEARVLVDLDQEPDPKVTRRLFVKGPYGGKGQERPSAVLEIPRELNDGLNDLGDVTLGAAPLFVAGRVVDEAGRAMPDLRLQLDTQATANQGWWEEDHGFSARTDDDGRFEVRGNRPGAAFRVTGKSEKHASRWTEFEPGASDVLVELAAPGGIAGRLLVDPGIDPTSLRLYLRGSPEDELVDGPSEMVTPAADGSFAFENLLTGGDREINVRSLMFWNDLATVEELDVVGGQVLRDPRLDPLDLRGQLFAHELVVVGGEESARVSGQVRFGPVDADTLEWQGYMNGRNLEFVAPYERLQLKAKFGGYRSVDLSDVGGRIEVELKDAIEVTIVLLGDVELPDPPIYVKAGLAPVGGDHSDLDLGGDPFDERGETRAKSPGVGRMEVHWVLERRMANGGFATSFAPPEPHFVDVLEGVEGQRFEITVTQEEIDEIVSRLP